MPLARSQSSAAAISVPAVASSVHLVVHCVLDADGRRRVAEIIAPTGVKSHAKGKGVSEAVNFTGSLTS